MPMAAALEPVALKATKVRATIPTTFSEWDQSLREISDDRLLAMDDDVCSFLGAVAGLTTPQLASGRRALSDEIEVRG
jgi:hypothetical protein